MPATQSPTAGPTRCCAWGTRAPRTRSHRLRSDVPARARYSARARPRTVARRVRNRALCSALAHARTSGTGGNPQAAAQAARSAPASARPHADTQAAPSSSAPTPTSDTQPRAGPRGTAPGAPASVDQGEAPRDRASGSGDQTARSSGSLQNPRTPGSSATARTLLRAQPTAPTPSEPTPIYPSLPPVRSQNHNRNHDRQPGNYPQ